MKSINKFEKSSSTPLGNYHLSLCENVIARVSLKGPSLTLPRKFDFTTTRSRHRAYTHFPRSLTKGEEIDIIQLIIDR